MSARRALVEAATAATASITVRAEDIDLGVARRALRSVPRRALSEPDLRPGPARRALAAVPELPERPRRALDEPVSFDAPILVPVTEDPAEFKTSEITAFRVPRKTNRRKSLMAVLSLAAVLTSVSGGAAIAHNVAYAQNETPVVAVPVEADSGGRQALSRNAARAMPEGADDPLAEAAQSVARRAEIVPEEVAPPVPEQVDIAGNIAPGQLPPASVEEAMARAESMVGNWGYNNMCLSLVATFYGYSSSGVEGAQQAAEVISAAGQMHTDMSDIPVGALIWYDGTPIGNPFGHVAMYAGNGMVYSNGARTGVGLMPIEEPAVGWGEPIIGWSSVWLPAATR